MDQTIRFRLNSRPVTVTTDGDRALLWVLRADLGLAGTKFGCGQSQCGACTVLVNREAVRSCRFPIRDAAGKEIVTIEGLERTGRYRWKAAKAPSGRGHGVVCLDYLGTVVAAMAEIKVDRKTGRITVVRVVHAQDMGPVINPEGARMQIEGGITMGLGYALSEEIRFSGGAIRDLDFGSYEIPRFSWAPKIEAVLIDNPEIAPSGCGEPPNVGVGGLMANALLDATGVRLTRLPLTPARILAKL